ncbi:SAM-dependent methyltransferase [Aliiroseovarius subalbicans]|uniref:SAM-dependent methyltransferase n=1 Tax=Aliiroseovarius subalbicans TaxID=2925840 RepID=UPI001F579B3A|nr:SAM-dependent methyltransferase [Aliiroseovarius subalbicans]MCI2400084.1 SAM-dependent methyltransferase [Aliiroseovarius subalbicans]
MTQTPPKLTDRDQLARNRARATPRGMFLQEDAADEVQDRLTEVNRTFTNPAVVTGFPHFWANFFPDAKIVHDDEVLDLEPQAHDLVIHGLSLHWANDPVGQLIQCRRALRADGLFLGVMFGGQTLSELRGILSEAEVALTGGLSPRIAPMGEIRDLGALLQRAGFALPVADSALRNVSYENAMSLMHDLRAMGEANALAQRRRHMTPRAMFRDVADRYAAHFGADGRIPATFEMIFLTGWAPDESQQKPLRPGSAAARLADALGTDETKLCD